MSLEPLTPGPRCRVPSTKCSAGLKYDQIWIDKTIEGEVAGVHFARPAKRPPSLGAAAVVVTPAVAGPVPLVTPSTPSVVTVQKPRWRARYDAQGKAKRQTGNGNS